jgi:hypothetical protein
MKPFHERQNLLAIISLTVTALSSPALLGDALVGDSTVSGDLDVRDNIDYGTTNATPSTSAVLQSYYAPNFTASWDITPANGNFLWRDDRIGTLHNKMLLNGDNSLILYNNVTAPTVPAGNIFLNPNTGVLNLSGTAPGIYIGGSLVMNAQSGGPAFSAVSRFTNTTDSTSSATGALIVSGGIGVLEDSHINGIRIGEGGGSLASNTALGASSLIGNTTGLSNTASGYCTLRLNTTGSNNSASGRAAMELNTTGSNNTAVGYAALQFNTTGSNNAAFGQNAGRYAVDGGNLTTVANSTFIGYNTRAQSDYNTNSIVIGFSAIGEGSNSTVIGNSSTTLTRLHGKTFTKSLDAEEDSYIHGIRIGSGAGTSTIWSTALGYNALNSNIGGECNTATGCHALYSNTAGNYNIATGTYAMSANTSGSSNVAVGYNALGTNTTGSKNIAIGEGAGMITQGSYDLINTKRSIYIGSYSKGYSANDENSIVIGADAVGEGTNTTVIGNSGTGKTHLYGQVVADSMKITGTAASTSKTTGALTVGGGLGVAGTVYANALNVGSLTLNNQSLSAWLSTSGFVTEANVDAKGYQTAAQVAALGYQTASMVNTTITSKGFLTSAAAAADGFLKEGDVDAKGYQTASQVVAYGYQTAPMVESTINSKGFFTAASAIADGFVKQSDVDAKGYQTATQVEAYGYQTASMVNSSITSKGYLTSASAAADGFLKQENVDAKGYQTASMVDSAIISKSFLTSDSATADGFLKQTDVDAKGYQTAADVSAQLASANLVTVSNIQATLATTPQVELGTTTIQGDAVLNGKITISQPQGDISMGIYGDD